MNRHYYLFWIFIGVSRLFFGQSDSLLFDHFEKYELLDEQFTMAELNPSNEIINYRVLFRTQALSSSFKYLQAHPSLLFIDSSFVTSCIANYLGDIKDVQPSCLRWLDSVASPITIKRLVSYCLAPTNGIERLDSFAAIEVQSAYNDWYVINQKKAWKSCLLATIVPSSAKFYRGDKKGGRASLFMHLALGGQLTESVIRKGWRAPITLLNGAFLLGIYSINLFDAVNGLKEKKEEAKYHYIKTLSSQYSTEEPVDSITIKMDTLSVAYEKRWLNAKNDSLKSNILLEKFKLHLQNQEVEKAIKLSYRINEKHLSDSLLTNYYWNLSLAYLLNSNESSANYHLLNYESLSKDSSTQFLLFKWLCFRNYNQDLNVQLVQELIQCDSIFLLLNDYIPSEELKSKSCWKSFLIPGSDLLLQGNVKEGIAALGINSLIGFSIYSMLRNRLWVNTVVWGTNLLGKFYFGQIRLAKKKSAETKGKLQNEKKHEFAKSYQNISIRYPLNYQL